MTATDLLAATCGSDPFAALTVRERQVAVLAASGLTHKLIGAHLGISERTVGVHVANAAKKLPGPGLPTRKLILMGQLLRPSSDPAPAV